MLMNVGLSLLNILSSMYPNEFHYSTLLTESLTNILAPTQNHILFTFPFQVTCVLCRKVFQSVDMRKTICQKLPDEIQSDVISDRSIIIEMNIPIWLARKKSFPTYPTRFPFLKNSNGLGANYASF